MAMQEFQYIQDILKDVYTPVIVNQVYKKSPVFAILKKKTAAYAGKRIVIPVRTLFTEAVGARAANNYNLPAAQKNSYDQAYIYMKRVYGRVMVDGFAIEAAKGKGGWIDVLQGEIEGSIDAFALNLDRMLMGDGKGILGVENGAISGQVITVKNPGGIAADSNPTLTKWLRKGMVLDIYDGTTPFTAKHADSVQISAVTSTTITLVGSIASCVANDVIMAEDTWEAAGPISGELMGLEGIIGAGNYGSDFEGIDATAEPTWQAYVQGTGSVLTEKTIQNDLDAIDDKSAGEQVDLAITTKTLRNKLIADQKLAYKTEVLNLVAGWKAIKYTGGEIELPIMAVKNAPTGYMYYLSQPHLTLYTLKELSWDDKLGGVIKGVAGMDAYESWFKLYANMGTNCRNANGKNTAYTIV